LENFRGFILRNLWLFGLWGVKGVLRPLFAPPGSTGHIYRGRGPCYRRAICPAALCHPMMPRCASMASCSPFPINSSLGQLFLRSEISFCREFLVREFFPGRLSRLRKQLYTCELHFIFWKAELSALRSPLTKARKNIMCPSAPPASSWHPRLRGGQSFLVLLNRYYLNFFPIRLLSFAQ
jgi:hypothetical protein